MPIVERRIFHINDLVENIDNSQFCFEPLEDPDLGFRMWCGKNDEGDITKWLAKDYPATLEWLALIGDDTTGTTGFIKHLSNGYLTGKHDVVESVTGPNGKVTGDLIFAGDGIVQGGVGYKTFTFSGTGGTGVTDHGGLTGLEDVEDHPGYITVDGSRDFTGDQSMGGHNLTGAALINSENSVTTPGSQRTLYNEIGTDVGGGVYRVAQGVWSEATGYESYCAIFTDGEAYLWSYSSTDGAHIQVSISNGVTIEATDASIHSFGHFTKETIELVPGNISEACTLQTLLGYEYTSGAYGIRISGSSASLESEILVTEDAGIDIISDDNGISVGASKFEIHNTYLNDSTVWRAEGYIDFADSTDEVDAAYALAGDTSASLLGLIIAASVVGSLDDVYRSDLPAYSNRIEVDDQPVWFRNQAVDRQSAIFWIENDSTESDAVDLRFIGDSGGDGSESYQIGHKIWTDEGSLSIGRTNSEGFSAYYSATNRVTNPDSRFVVSDLHAVATGTGGEIDAYVRVRAGAISGSDATSGIDISADGIIQIASQSGSIFFADTPITDVKSISFGYQGSADITSSVITVDWESGSNIQKVSTGAAITNVKMTPPTGSGAFVLRVSATGDRTITNFTKADGATSCVTWKGDIDPDAGALTIPSTTIATFIFLYDEEADNYEGWVSMDV
jgi:hypothetical protein